MSYARSYRHSLGAFETSPCTQNPSDPVCVEIYKKPPPTLFGLLKAAQPATPSTPVTPGIASTVSRMPMTTKLALVGGVAVIAYLVFGRKKS